MTNTAIDTYNPPLSEAGFMDLILAIQTLLKEPSCTKLLAQMPTQQRAAALQVGLAAKSYVDLLERQGNAINPMLMASMNAQSKTLADHMARLNRVLTINGQQLAVPQYVNRTVSGWQVRVRGVPSIHFADDIYGWRCCTNAGRS